MRAWTPMMMLIAGCPHAPPGASTTAASGTAEPGTTSYRTVDSDLTDPGGATFRVHAKWVRLPEDGSPADLWVRNFMFGEELGKDPPADHVRWLKTVEAAWRDDLSANPEMVAQWDLSREVDVAWRGAGVLSLCGNESDYLGGAHPNSDGTCAMFSLANGAPVSVADLFGGAVPAAVVQAGEAAFREARGLDATVGLEEEGYAFDNNVFTLPSDGHLTAEGLAFNFDPYEIAPYVMGGTDFVVPWSVFEGRTVPQFSRGSEPSAPPAAQDHP
jgi:hypothetical protein